MGVEEHAYGTSLWLVSRRQFVMVFCAVMTVYCFAETGRYLFGLESVRTTITGAVPSRKLHEDCTGDECYEVLSCFGMRKTSMHLSTPFFPVLGLVFFPVGAYGAQAGHHKEVRTVAVFLVAMAALHMAILALDGIYVKACNAYPQNIVDSVLLGWTSLAPVSPAAARQLGRMSSWPVEDVARATGNLNVLAWYYSMWGLLAALLAYAAWEAVVLTELVEFGPLGLGAHYGLANWDTSKLRQWGGKFIDDSRQPLTNLDEEAGAGYGSMARAYETVLPQAVQLAPDLYFTDEDFEAEADPAPVRGTAPGSYY